LGGDDASEPPPPAFRGSCGCCCGFAARASAKADLAKLLFFESSTLGKDGLTSLDEYIARMSPEQDTIYYLCAPNRKLAEQSPYYETFKEHDREV